MYSHIRTEAMMVPNRETIMKVKLASVGSLVLFATEFRGGMGCRGV